MSPAYDADKVWDPGDSVEVEIMADPPDIVAVPIAPPLSWKATVPVALEGVMVAVMVTESPIADGLGEEARARVAVALLIVTEQEPLDERSFPSPPYVTERE
jgi:hypothetical protein